MANERQPGNVFMFGEKRPCETEGCENETNSGIWDGDRWCYICESHQSAFQNELREKGLRP